MVGRLVNLRLDSKFLKELDSVARQALYSSRTEFIKQALHKAVDNFRTEQSIRELRKHFGEGKRLGIKEPTPAQFEKIRAQVWEELHGNL